MVEHEVLKTKLRPEFDRLNIKDEKIRDALTTELNRLAVLLIEVCPEPSYES
jgi:hypothetical protein